MHDDFISSLKWQYSSYSTPELLGIWGERHTADSNYIEETFEAVRQILAEREALPSGHTAHRGPSDDTEHGHGSTETLSFSCVFCSHKLTIRLPLDSGAHFCASCGAAYDPVTIHREPNVILLVPKQRAEPRSQSDFGKRDNPIPPEIKTALSVLGLTEFASFEEAKQAYRNTVRQYHPDRVTHLGPELQKLAESKTKELITAYEKIRRFFSGPRT